MLNLPNKANKCLNPIESKYPAISGQPSKFATMSRNTSKLPVFDSKKNF